MPNSKLVSANQKKILVLICQICGTHMTGQRASKKYCPDCLKKRTRDYAKKYAQKKYRDERLRQITSDYPIFSP